MKFLPPVQTLSAAIFLIAGAATFAGRSTGALSYVWPALGLVCFAGAMIVAQRLYGPKWMARRVQRPK